MSDVPYVGLCGCKSFLLPCYSASHPTSSLQTSSLEYSSLFPVSLFSFLCPDDRPNTFLAGYLSIYLSSPLQWKFRRSASLEVLKSPDQSCLIEWSSSAISAGCCPLHFALDHFMDKQMSRCLVIIHFLVLSQWDVSERTIFRKVQFNINRKTIFSNIFLYNHIC